MASTDAKPVPQKNVAYRVTFPILDADGDLVTGASGLDSEVSKDGGTFADCTNEATEIATSSGVYYLDLTSTEMNADTVAVIVKTSSSGAKTTTIIMYPEEAGDIRVNVTQFNGTNVTARDIGASVLLSSGTGTGQVTLTSGRVNADVTHIATAAVSTSTAQLGVNVVNFGGSAGTFSGGRPEVNTSHWAGTAVGSTTVRANLINIAGSAVSTSTAQLGVNVVNAGGTAWASGSLTSGVFATGAITATAIAADAIGASELAADAATEIATAVWASATRVLTANTNLNDPTAAAIADAVWDEDATGHQTGGTFGQAIGDPGADTTTIYQSVVTDAAGTNVAADIIAVKAQTAAIETDTAEIGVAGAGLTNINLPNQTMDIVGNITGNLSGSVGSVTGAVGSVTGLTAADVGAIKAVTDKADTALELDGSVYRFTTNSLEQAPTGGSAPSAADIRAEIDANSTQLAAILTDTGTTLDGKIDAIKAKTDSLTFTVANQVDSNIQYVNDVQVNGNGQAGTEWGP